MKTTTVRIKGAGTRKSTVIEEHGKGLSLNSENAVEVWVYGEPVALVRIAPNFEVVWQNGRFADDDLIATVEPSTRLMTAHFGATA